MARPGDEDFVWSDFEDYSDFEDDLKELEAADDAGNSTEDEPVDGSATTGGAAGGSGTTYPCDVCGKVLKSSGWLTRHKNTQHGPSTEGPSLEETPQAGAGEESSKKAKPPRKLKIHRPTSKFTEEDAVQAGPELMKKALEEAAENPIWLIIAGKKPTPGNIAAQTAKELLETFVVSQHTDFVTNLCRELWSVIVSGDRAILCSSAKEVMFSKYYHFCVGSSYRHMWTEFMHVVCKGPCPLLQQFLTEKIFEGLLKKRHIVDAPMLDTPNVDTKLTSEEEQVVRYVAGFIPYALLKRYRRLHTNKVAQLYATILQQWKVSSTHNTHTTFLKYTEGWINEVNRGGLFVVSDTVYIFFRHVENVVRCTANFGQFSQGRLQGLREEIMKNLESSYTVNHYWCEIASSHIPEEKLSKNLLEVVLLYYVNLRCRAFADVYILVQKRKNSDFASKKGEKSLRKSLDK